MDNQLKTLFKKRFLKGIGKQLISANPVKGVEISTANAGLYKKKKRDDLTLFYFKDGATLASAYTTSKVCAECIHWNKKISKEQKIKALFVNTKNANALTGIQGFDSLKKISKFLELTKKIKKKEILFSSTGVIGEKFPIDKIKHHLPNLINNLKPSNPTNWIKSAKAIMTTDTIGKLSQSTYKIQNKNNYMVGIAKGSGMIFPNMATMLSFVFCDTNISQNLLNYSLQANLKKTFNCITVDGDTSTNDMILVFSTKKANNKIIKDKNSKDFKVFDQNLFKVMLSLAQQITFDGEGASKFVEVEVSKAKSYENAKTIAFSISNSQLVKTAIAGEDPNWGRILMAIGKTGLDFDVNKVTLKLGDQIIFKNGSIQKNYNENKAKKYMKKSNIKIFVDLNQGKQKFTSYTCDLTHEYISINADYRN